jgi:hypothetical protein
MHVNTPFEDKLAEKAIHRGRSAVWASAEFREMILI